MSIDLDSPQLPRPRKHKSLKEKDERKREKKRKRSASDEVDCATKKKKHRSQYNSDHSQGHDDSPKKQAAPPTSSYYHETTSLYLPLPPISQKYALKGMCAEHLSPLILTYYPPFNGVILSYNNARLTTHPLSETKPAYAKSIDEYAASFVWLTADFLVFKPQEGDVLEGWVNLQNESNIGLLYMNFFNITIERRRLAKGWKWISGGVKPHGKRKLENAEKGGNTDLDDGTEADPEVEENAIEDSQGHFQDSQKKKVEGLVRFRVKDVETSRSMDRETSFLNIEGTMLNEEEEEELRKREGREMREKGKGQPKHAIAGALLNGLDGLMDIDEPAALNPSSKHRAKY